MDKKILKAMNQENYNLKQEDFNTAKRPTWCIGCGNYGIWNALKRALVDLKLLPYQVLLVYGIGCSGNGNNFIKTYAFHSLHGMALPSATGARLANNKMKVLISGGDGDGVGIGGNHFIHTCRRNLDMTYLVHDNRIYGLTTGQTSPTSEKGFKSKSTPMGVLEQPVNPILLALVSGATFVARGYSLEMEQLKNLIIEGVNHKGFAFIDVLQPCVTFNKNYSYSYYKDKVYKLEEEGNHDPGNLELAIKKSLETERLALGIFYKVQKPTYEEGLKAIESKPLVEHDISNINIENLIRTFY